MADSVDRVFAHALSTVRKIPHTRSARPPAADRLRLYGLYKQSMEGDVVGIMARPVPSSLAASTFGRPGSSSSSPRSPQLPPPAATSIDPKALAEAEAAAPPEERAEMEKWDAWFGCKGLSRMEAKRRYIGTLIRTMKAYASGTKEARALVEELEFVWEQVKDSQGDGGGELAENSRARAQGGGGLRVLRPMSDGDEEELELDERDEEDEYRRGRGSEQGRDAQEDEDDSGSRHPSHAGDNLTPARWRRRIERSLIQMTAEVAALKELLDATQSQRRLWKRNGKRGWFVWAWLATWKLLKRMCVDAVLFGLVLMVLRWRYRERTEDWWEWLGEAMGFVRGRVRDGVKEGLRRGKKVDGRALLWGGR